MSKVVTFGEIMLRLSPYGFLRFTQTDKLQYTFGGAEANVAVALAHLGVDVSYITKLPKNDIANAAINDLRRYGVDTSKIVTGGDRVGIYYLEKGASQRASKVIYDRAYSSISQANIGDFDWDKIFEDTKWFHLTGITPALKGNLPQICLEACKKAKEKNITISCDINFRKKLWTSEEANEIMSSIMPYVDICFANEEDAETVFGIKASNTNIINGELSLEGYKEVANELTKRFNFKAVAITLRSSISASDNKWSAMLYHDNNYYFSKEYFIRIIERVGGGDSFAAGLIYSMMNNMQVQDCLEFATAASCLKHSIEGDFNRVNVDEIMTLMKGDGSGRVQR